MTRSKSHQVEQLSQGDHQDVMQTALGASEHFLAATGDPNPPPSEQLVYSMTPATDGTRRPQLHFPGHGIQEPWDESSHTAPHGRQSPAYMHAPIMENSPVRRQGRFWPSPTGLGYGPRGMTGVKLTLPKFDGHSRWQTFIHQFEAITWQWPEDQRLYHLLASLHDEAADYTFDLDPAARETYYSLVEELDRRFRTTKTPQTLARQFG